MSLRRFETVWCAAGMPNAVFEVTVEAPAALADARSTEVFVPLG